MAGAPASAATAAGNAGAAAAAAAPAKTVVLPLQRVGGFEAVVSAVCRLLAGARGAGRSVEEALGGGAEAVTDKGFLLAALKACPDQAADLLAHLVWCGQQPPKPPPQQQQQREEDDACSGSQYAAAAAVRGGGGALVAGMGGIGERALTALLEIVLDSRRALSVSVGTAATAAELARRQEGAVDLRTGMGVLSRVLHLNDRGVRERLDVALRRLEAAVRASQEEGSSAAAGCGGEVYLTGKLVASLFLHLPEARPALSRMPFLSPAVLD
ncbi:unnamed protein product [Ectocarpus sp. 8 AP-2014]